jgi:hypothetical protein
MNERIKLLAEQAGIEFTYDPTETPMRAFVECWEDDLEKFAELIVKECATTCDNIGKEARKEWKAKYIPHDDGRSDGAWECKAAILEHFGVEE